MRKRYPRGTFFHWEMRRQRDELHSKHIQGCPVGQENNRLRNIEFLRGVAALWVIAVHARSVAWIGIREQLQHYQHIDILDQALGFLTIPLSWGEFGVPLFFVISGYVIHLAQARVQSLHAGHRLNAPKFYARRAIKIYPALIVALGLTAFLGWLTLRHLGSRVQSNLALDWITAIGQLFGLQNLLVRPYGANGPLWTLALEMQFYLVYPYLLKSLTAWGWRRVFASSVLIALLCGYAQDVLEIKFFLAFYPAWLIGAWLAEQHTQRDSPVFSRRAMAALSLVGIVGGIWCHRKFDYGTVLFLSLPAICMIEMSRHWNPRSILARQVERLGAASYSIYLLHSPLIVCMCAIWFDLKTFDSPLPSVGLIIPCVAAGWLMYRLVESPSNEAGKRWLARFSAQRSAGVTQA
jgi:peptidoglycan/LPS O-acetylase OafA/YrhL